MPNGMTGESRGMFPSPYGELHFSIRTGVLYRKRIISFRPLTGNYISQLWSGSWGDRPERRFRPLTGNYISQFVSRKYDCFAGSFRPLTGNYISQFMRQNESPIMLRFRPLTGNYISQSFVWIDGVMTDEEFPSPYGELHFSI